MLNNDANGDDEEDGADNAADGFFIARKHKTECVAYGSRP